MNRHFHLPLFSAAILGSFGFAFADEPVPKPTLSVSSPTDYQVFQRQTVDLGAVHVKGRLSYEIETIEARLTGRSPAGGLGEKWEPVPSDVEGDGFSGDLQAPAGGWYRLEIRARKSDEVVASAVIEHVGVGEVFVGAGQSNSTNYGSERQTVSTGLVSSFDGDVWRLANDPQPGAQDSSQGGSFWPAFGDALAEKYRLPIGVAVTGCGATSVREWLPRGSRFAQEPTTGKHVSSVAPGEWESTGDLFDGLTSRVAKFGPHGIRAVLWHQGESDAGQTRGGASPDRQITGDQYRAFMEKLVNASREKAGWPIPWFVAQATYHAESDPSDDEFRAAQKALWDSGLALRGPDTDALRGRYRAGVHFNGPGLRAHGQAWAERVGDFLDRWETVK